MKRTSRAFWEYSQNALLRLHKNPLNQPTKKKKNHNKQSAKKQN